MAGTLRRSFGARVRALRRERNLTQEELALRSRLSVEAVGRIERGAFSPTLETIRKLAGGLEVTFRELFHHTPEARQPSAVQLCQYVSRLKNGQRRAVWEVLLSLFDGGEEPRPAS